MSGLEHSVHISRSKPVELHTPLITTRGRLKGLTNRTASYICQIFQWWTNKVSIVFYHSSTKRGKLFNFVFHTSFVDKEDDDGHVTLTLGRRKIDGACKSKAFNPCFEVEVWMTADPNFMQDSVPTRQSIHPKLSRITMAFTSNRQGLHSTKAESVSREAEVTNAAIPVSDKSTGLHDSKSWFCTSRSWSHKSRDLFSIWHELSKG